MLDPASELRLKRGWKSSRKLRKAGDRYKVVTSQTDWPSYNGDPSGNRYTRLTQIDKANVAGLAPKWVFPLPNVTQVETSPSHLFATSGQLSTLITGKNTYAFASGV